MKKQSLDAKRKWLIAAGFLISGGGQGALSNALSPFVKPVTEGLAFSRGAFTLYTSITFLIAMLLLPVYGELYRKKYFPTLMVLAALIAGLVPFGYSASRSLAGFYLFAALLGVVFNGVSMTAVGSILTRWFGRNRGLATGISFSGSGLLAAVVLRVASTVIDRFGWEWGYRAVGLCSMAMLLTGTLIIRIIEQRTGGPDPEDPEFRDDSVSEADSGISLAEARKRTAFRGILAAAVLTAYITQSGATNVMAYTSDLGYSSLFQSRLASASMVCQAATKIFTGRVLDRKGIGTGFVIASVTLTGFALAALGLSVTSAAAAPYSLFFGFTGCMTTVLISYAVSAAFGKKDYARIYALSSIGTNIGLMIGNVLPGFIFDRSGSYLPAWWFTLGVALVLSLVLFATYRDIRRIHAEAENISKP